MICNKISECYNAKIKASKFTSCPHNQKKCIDKEGKISNVKCEENGKVYVLQNTENKYIISYRMDGGVIKEDKSVPNGTNKCDYVFMIEDKSAPKVILIELKGVSVKKALLQLLGTIDLYENFLNSCSNVFGRIVVTSSTPKLKADPSYITLSKKIKVKYNGNIKIQEKRLLEKYIDLTLS